MSDPLERFLDFVSPEPNTGCWLWTGALRNSYGAIGVNGKTFYAHRWYWEELNGPIPKGFQIDHICRVRECVNPRHLRVVSPRENNLAPGSLTITKFNAGKTHCAHGHIYDDENTERRTDESGGRMRVGNRECRECRMERQRRHYYSQKHA